MTFRELTSKEVQRLPYNKQQEYYDELETHRRKVRLEAERKEEVERQRQQRQFIADKQRKERKEAADLEERRKFLAKRDAEWRAKSMKVMKEIVASELPSVSEKVRKPRVLKGTNGKAETSSVGSSAKGVVRTAKLKPKEDDEIMDPSQFKSPYLRALAGLPPLEEGASTVSKKVVNRRVDPGTEVRQPVRRVSKPLTENDSPRILGANQPIRSSPLVKRPVRPEGSAVRRESPKPVLKARPTSTQTSRPGQPSNPPPRSLPPSKLNPANRSGLPSQKGNPTRQTSLPPTLRREENSEESRQRVSKYLNQQPTGSRFKALGPPALQRPDVKPVKFVPNDDPTTLAFGPVPIHTEATSRKPTSQVNLPRPRPLARPNPVAERPAKRTLDEPKPRRPLPSQSQRVEPPVRRQRPVEPAARVVEKPIKKQSRMINPMDDVLDEEYTRKNYSSIIGAMFGYNRNRYVNDHSDEDMEVSAAHVLLEERRSARIGRKEDELEEIREREREERLRKKKAAQARNQDY